ncbi:MAG: M28 family metallopeptidase [Oscillospiraceae bacterium]|nr:M28 family metallopeptidase [Oscillospiraceae bacterium]
MRNIIYSMILIISLCSLHISSLYFNYKDKFNVDNVMNHIEDLSSDYYKGRLAGTKENEDAENYITNYFSNISLLPYAQSYKDSFTVSYPEQTSGKPFLQIKTGYGQIYKTFKYNIDFREDFVNFKITDAKFTLENIVQNQEKSLSLKTRDGIVIFYEEDLKSKFRSSFIVNADCSLLIFVTKDALLDIKKSLSQGMSLTVKIPYEIKEASVSNISGGIKGLSDNSKIVFTSHFDGLGQSIAGDIYPGALDDASGTAFILELSRFLKPLSTPLNDIVFASFNAEEFGLLGSQYFAKENKDSLINSSVINMDMIGGDQSSIVHIVSSKNSSPNNKLVKDFSDICTKEGINYAVDFNDLSDHFSFSKEGIDAITISDTESNSYHTPEDKAEYVNKDNIKRSFDIVWEYLINTAYKDNIFLKYDDTILLSSIIVICVILAFKFQKEGFY